MKEKNMSIERPTKERNEMRFKTLMSELEIEKNIEEIKEKLNFEVLLTPKEMTRDIINLNISYKEEKEPHNINPIIWNYIDVLSYVSSFFSSLAEQFEEKGCLTQKQWDCFLKQAKEDGINISKINEKFVKRNEGN